MKFPTLYHYTQGPVDFHLYHAVQPTGPFEMKPYGIWTTDDGEDNWEQWCRSEEFNLHKLRYRLRMQLKPTANILWIKNAVQLDEFTRKYRKENNLGFDGYIDWVTVTNEYQGILIIPYLWERRLHQSNLWYYGWDCASGCFWSPNVWEHIELDRDYRDSNQKRLA